MTVSETLPMGGYAGDVPTVEITAEIAATVCTVDAAPGSRVLPGDLLMVLESMKMQIPIRADRAATVVDVAIEVGDTVRNGDVLCRLTAENASLADDAGGDASVSSTPEARLAALFDPGSMRLLDADDGSGVRTAEGAVEGIRALAYASDRAVQGGALGMDGCMRITRLTDRAVSENVPVLGVWHSGGARLAEGVSSLDGMGQMFASITRASGRVPQISVILGPAAGGAAYGPALTDVVVMARGAKIFVTGPGVVASVTGESVDMETLGGADTHLNRSGVAHIVGEDDADAVARARAVTVLLSGQRRSSWTRSVMDPGSLLPDQADVAYDVHPVVSAILDENADDAPAWHELQAGWAPNIVTGLGRLEGRPVGVLANNPIRRGGCLDSESAEKASRFVRLCDSFGIPLLVLVDVPGYLPGVDQEWNGVVRRGAKLLHAFSDASVARITVILRKAYGGAYIAMNSHSLGASAVFAWPGAEIAVMGATAAVRILKRRDLAGLAGDELAAKETELAEAHLRESGGIDPVIEAGWVDAIIEPAATRDAVVEAFRGASHHRNGIRNIPL
ncbi:carboxyl transferase domain-containing protein [Gordonia hydrophobica]|uniref:Carboxyl transferase domain-containing protein n=1 Tax=Gordonia hydrophobica TaxID=40516 RepID=A0ABZ2U507_9ACTN|nr:carboxyl transferase domain-containing protein [Gordonia hydrophobica]MBM7368644.1 acetyl-CoA/propionyl-CoA carboxylase carboxyl transferase subunit [Gordonia hydrophobica]